MKMNLRFLLVAMLAAVISGSTIQAKFPFVHQFSVQPWVRGDSPWNVDLAIDGLNRVHLLWAMHPAADKYHLHLYYRCYASDGQPLTEINDITPAGYEIWGQVIAIACNSWGKLAIAAYLQDFPTDQNHPVVWMSDSTGVLQPPIEFGQDVIYPWTCDDPGLAVSESGRTIVVMDNYGINYGDSIYYEVYDENNQKIGVTRSGTSGEFKYHDALYPRVAVAPSGQFVMVWATNHAVDLSWPYAPLQVCARVFSADGDPLSGDLIVPCEGFPEHCFGDSAIFHNGGANGQMPDIELQENGDFAVLYSSGLWTCDYGLTYLRRFNADGSPKGPNVNASDQSNCYIMSGQTRIASDLAGNLFAAFLENVEPGSSRRNVLGQRYDDKGERVGSNYRFNDAPPSGDTVGSVDLLAADMNNNGLAAVAWWDWGAFAPGWNLVLQIMDVSDMIHKPGDANDDKVVDISDAVFLINYIFAGGWAPKDVCCGDANGDLVVDISDAVALIGYIFGGGSIAGQCPQ